MDLPVEARESLVQERDEALRHAWTLSCQNEALRTRLHEVIRERNELKNKR